MANIQEEYKVSVVIYNWLPDGIANAGHALVLQTIKAT